MSALDSQEFREAVLDVVKQRKAEGKSFIKPVHVTAELDDSPQRAGNHLRAIEEEGYIERWDPETNRAVWLIPDDPEP